MTNVVSAVKLGVRTRRGWVFRDVDAQVGRGELVVVTGPSGSGRTSLLLALAGRFRTTHGTLTRHGRAALAYVPGVTDPEPNLTVAEHLEEHRLLTGRAGPVQTADRRLARDLSILDRHLLGLALARLDEPDVIFVDDADTGLSGAERDRLWAELRTLADDGIAVVAACREAPEHAGADHVITLETTR
jgi:ABC-2 type transport system ATP-binding protein